jgi:hypothetical protein
MLALYTDDYFWRDYYQAKWAARLDLEVRRLGKRRAS